MFSGQPQKTAGAALLETLGVPEEYSEIVYGGVDALGVTKVLLKSPQTGALIEVSLDKSAKDAVITSGSLDSKTGQFKPTEVSNGNANKGTTGNNSILVNANKELEQYVASLSNSKLNQLQQSELLIH